jgi:Heparinase II/III-like protein/Heparinase II/III N-terminus
MNRSSKILLGFKAMRELGPAQVGWYGLYRLGLRSGHYRRQLQGAIYRQNKINQADAFRMNSRLLTLPERESLLNMLASEVKDLYSVADEIVSGQIRLFGGLPVPLVLKLAFPLEDWSRFASDVNQINGQDIKIIWEPARFGWACTLARAYYLSKDEKYADSFWNYTEIFLASNPPYFGPHWSSAQEAAIRLVALAFCIQVFIASKTSTPDRLESLAKAIAYHAERIPPTLAYARSQNNNHLMCEALGMYTASAILPGHPYASKWHKLGLAWLTNAFRSQISTDGTYIQHSTNYHRLMLQAALWASTIQQSAYPNEPFPPEVRIRLEASTQWIWRLLDPDSGRVPNLGHNDGAYFLPLTVCPYDDYRPIIQAAVLEFLHTSLNPTGPWSEMATWLCQREEIYPNSRDIDPPLLRRFADRPASDAPCVLFNQRNGSWAMLRAATFHARPAHADQLHLDLWWRGLNIAQDPGTYLYNSASPWDNALTSTLVHNTITVDGLESMQRAGRFLYLDWAQVKIHPQKFSADGSSERISAEHDGYHKLGVVHTRKVVANNDGHWEVLDRISGSPEPIHSIRLHWLLPDWEYELPSNPIKDENSMGIIRLCSPYGWLELQIDAILSGNASTRPPVDVKLIRAGKILVGSGSALEITGWTSPTYGVKIPALAYIVEIRTPLPLELKTQWFLPNEA